MQKAVQTEDDENERELISRDGGSELHKALLLGLRSLSNDTGAPVDLSCLYREIHSGPRREVGRLPARYFVCERNSVVRIRTQVGVRLEVTQHLCYLGGHGEERSENFRWAVLE
jgi:hypothetical protein